ncbi:uncharacterized protein TRAVEDRAFT_52859 [Trametes versicolor FP-101664 SS1]|uniref:uncharacterized protein n=1 Tax=Trametes versicolor (strain FP-101664) TaxID=717944 RepID=UPI0004621975|nr:uncharacterized protein TRAVEDRAFT_52859 [Trametes versicolor FP-101664 SS1]EIW53736.1 hypothetical protein TRAVEDRAFT_52859 [Trametes versicolor FP-101664 SS1]
MSTTQLPKSTALPEVPALDNTYGALLIGTFLGLILYGLTLHQAYRYFRLYPNDSKWLNILVAMVLSGCGDFYELFGRARMLVTNYFHPQALTRPSWSVMIISMNFFVRRVWIIGARFRPLVIVSILCTLAAQGVLTAVTIKGFIGADQDSSFEEEFALGTKNAIASALALVGDLLLTSVLIYVLHRSRTGYKRTDSMIDLMIMYSVGTGLLTEIAEILTTILAMVYPAQQVYVVVGIPATKCEWLLCSMDKVQIIDEFAEVCANTLLVALNSRQYIASCGGSSVSNEISVFGSAPPPLPGSTGGEEAFTPQLRRAMRAATNDADMSPAVIELSLVAGAGARGVRAEKEVV